MAGGNGKPLRAEEMIEAIEQARGFVTKASDILGVSTPTFYKYLHKYVTVQEALENMRSRRTEYVENKLMKQIDNDNLTAIIFYLKTQAGWRETHRIEHGGDTTINVKLMDNG